MYVYIYIYIYMLVILYFLRTTVLVSRRLTWRAWSRAARKQELNRKTEQPVHEKVQCVRGRWRTLPPCLTKRGGGYC